MTDLDEYMPAYDFSERHHRRIDADPDEAWQALLRLRLTDLSVTRPLVALRHAGRSGPDGPLLTTGPLTLLHRDDGGHLAIGGAVARPWRPHAPRLPAATLAEFGRADEPGWTKYLTVFRVGTDAGGTVVSTETRGYSTDRRARLSFAAYWALIRLPSGIVRRDVLRTVDRLTR